MKENRRFFIFILCVIVAFSAAACSQNRESYSEISYYISDGRIDFSGSNIILGQDSNSGTEPFGYKADSTLCDMFIQRAGEINNKYNCKLTVELIPDVNGAIRNSLWAATETGFDMVYYGSGNANFAGAVNGLLYPLTDSEYLDVTDYGKCGVPNLQECCMMDGVVYGIVPSNLPMVTSNGCGSPLTLINEGYIKRFSMNDPRELYENDMWTLDYFRDHVADYYVNDGAKEIYSFVLNNEYWGCGYIGSYGIRLVSDYEGETYTCFDHPLITEALNEAILCQQENRQYLDIVSSWDYWTTFVNGNDLMCIGNDAFVKEVCTDLDDFGLVLFPTSKYVEKDTQFTYYSSVLTLSIPGSGEDADSISCIISDMIEPYNGYDRDSYAKLLFNTTFFDMRDVNVFLDFPKNECFNYYAVGGAEPLKAIIAINSAQSVKQTVESNGNKFQAIAENYIMGNFEKVMKPYYETKTR